MPDSVAVYPITYPGRSDRLSEAPLRSIEAIIRALADEIDSKLEEPYAFFGHSMGALLAFEYTRTRARIGKRLPEVVFVAGARAPHIPREKPIHHLSDVEFINELRRMKGTPSELLEDPEAMSLFLPALRADFTAVETYIYREGPALGCPVSILQGADDGSVRIEQAREWNRHTVLEPSLTVFPGDHFFPFQCPGRVIETVKGCLEPLAAKHR